MALAANITLGGLFNLAHWFLAAVGVLAPISERNYSFLESKFDDTGHAIPVLSYIEFY